MPNALRTFRSRHFRLLASWLVMLAILCNGIGLAQAHSSEMKNDCCAEMMGEKMSPDKPCAMPDQECDDQCMARCMTANSILSVPLSFTPCDLVTTALPQLKAAEHSLTELGPGLRPPIYS